jgi:hypothetical protein
MTLAIIWTWTCDECGKTHAKEQGKLLPGNTVIHYDIPSGWHFIRGRMVCDEHKITIEPRGAPEAPGPTSHSASTLGPGEENSKSTTTTEMVQFRDDNWEEVFDFLPPYVSYSLTPDGVLTIRTPTTEYVVHKHDWIVRDARGFLEVRTSTLPNVGHERFIKEAPVPPSLDEELDARFPGCFKPRTKKDDKVPPIWPEE